MAQTRLKLKPLPLLLQPLQKGRLLRNILRLFKGLPNRSTLSIFFLILSPLSFFIFSPLHPLCSLLSIKWDSMVVNYSIWTAITRIFERELLRLKKYRWKGFKLFDLLKQLRFLRFMLFLIFLHMVRYGEFSVSLSAWYQRKIALSGLRWYQHLFHFLVSVLGLVPLLLFASQSTSLFCSLALMRVRVRVSMCVCVCVCVRLTST